MARNRSGGRRRSSAAYLVRDTDETAELDIARAKGSLLMRQKARAIFANVEARSRDFALRLSQIAFPSKPEIRILGLAIGLEFEDEDYVEELRERCRNEGLIINATEGVVTLFPALDIDERTAQAGLDILERCAA